jgi:hypothetical protein
VLYAVGKQWVHGIYSKHERRRNMLRMIGIISLALVLVISLTSMTNAKAGPGNAGAGSGGSGSKADMAVGGGHITADSIEITNMSGKTVPLELGFSFVVRELMGERNDGRMELSYTEQYWDPDQQEIVTVTEAWEYTLDTAEIVPDSATFVAKPKISEDHEATAASSPALVGELIVTVTDTGSAGDTGSRDEIYLSGEIAGTGGDNFTVTEGSVQIFAKS